MLYKIVQQTKTGQLLLCMMCEVCPSKHKNVLNIIRASQKNKVCINFETVLSKA